MRVVVFKKRNEDEKGQTETKGVNSHGSRTAPPRHYREIGGLLFSPCVPGESLVLKALCGCGDKRALEGTDSY